MLICEHSFLVFLMLLFIFIRKTRKSSTSSGEGGMMRYTAAAVVGSLLIYLRTVFRLGETAEGVGGFAQTHESLFGGKPLLPLPYPCLSGEQLCGGQSISIAQWESRRTLGCA